MNLVIESVTKHYFNFSGRARRKEYWLFILAYIIVLIVAGVIDTISGFGGGAVGPIYIIAVLALIIPSLAVSARRLHDTNRSGWWLLLYLLPGIGSIILFIFFCLKGTDGENRFGANPIIN